MSHDAATIWQPFLARRGVVVLDGGLATELERRGAALDDPLWSAKILLEQPQLIEEVHADYFRAGADVGTSASYQATLPGLARRGLDSAQAAAVLRLSVRLVQQARDSVATHGATNRLVAASLGSYGAYRADGSEFRGDYDLSSRQLLDWHRPRCAILAESGADILAFETVPCLSEGEAIVRLVEEFPALPAWISFSCRDEQHLCSGEPFADAVRLANDASSVAAIGINCTAPRHIAGLLQSVRGLTVKPLAVYPNSGERWDNATRSWQAAPDDFSWPQAVRRWHELGARLIGGCCRTTPATIRQIASAF